MPQRSLSNISPSYTVSLIKGILKVTLPPYFSVIYISTSFLIEKLDTHRVARDFKGHVMETPSISAGIFRDKLGASACALYYVVN